MEETFHELPCWRVTQFIWMIAWARKTLIHHVGHHSYFVEAMRQLASFHSHFPPLIGANILVLHTWEETLEYNLFVDPLDVVMEAIDGRPHEEEGRNCSLLIHFLEDKQIFWRGGL